MKYFDKKTFWRTFSISMIVWACLMTTACGDWETQAINIIQLLGPALSALLSVLAAFGVGVSPVFMEKFTQYSTEAQNDLLTVKGLLQQIKDASAEAQPGLVNQIEAIMATVQQNLQALLPDLHITNAESQARVVAAFNAISGFITSILALLPKAADPNLTVSAARALNAEAEKKAGDFKKDFNEAVGYFGKQYEI